MANTTQHTQRPMTWLRERNNDPDGTPITHPFWSGPAYWQKRGIWRVVRHDGIVAAYDTQHNAWYGFDDLAEALRYAEQHPKPMDPWT